MMRTLLLLMALLLAPCTQAKEPTLQHFISGSMQKIDEAHRGQPYVLLLWSLDCMHCAEELAFFGKLARDTPRLPVVIVATDSPQDSVELSARLKKFGLAQLENWVFDDEVPERLRSEIDRKWRGEVPRSYFFDREHRPRVVTGPPQLGFVEQWLKENPL